MTKLRIEARVDYRVDGKPTSKNVPVYCIAPGESQIDWQTEKVLTVADLKKLFEAANKSKAITLLMEANYGSMAFPNHRDIDFISIQFSQWQASGAGGKLATATCKDLTVVKTLPLTPHLVELSKAKHISLDGVDTDKAQTDTLRVPSAGFTVT
jgi:hypothetical protein